MKIVTVAHQQTPEKETATEHLPALDSEADRPQNKKDDVLSLRISSGLREHAEEQARKSGRTLRDVLRSWLEGYAMGSILRLPFHQLRENE